MTVRAMHKHKCPLCGDTQTVRGSSEVAHRCPKARQNKLTYYERLQDE